MNLYIGNLSRTVTEADLAVLFEGCGEIVFMGLAGDREARGYAFVTVADDGQARHLFRTMNGKYLKGLRLIIRPVVDAARQARALRAHKTSGRPLPKAALAFTGSGVAPRLTRPARLLSSRSRNGAGSLPYQRTTAKNAGRSPSSRASSRRNAGTRFS
ncbi:RNA recognition motif domain-containing protein [Acidiferrobacter sp.]|uniref:RNA recognition motif domain-containing protein n=1 Tax=Acidiferrobacter sp. TaxID=1872107 RepID=UPI00345BEEA5